MRVVGELEVYEVCNVRDLNNIEPEEMFQKLEEAGGWMLSSENKKNLKMYKTTICMFSDGTYERQTSVEI